MAVNIKKDLLERIEVPEGVNVTLENTLRGTKISVKKEDKELVRTIPLIVPVKKEDNIITLTVKKASKTEKRNFGTSVKHIQNMINGVNEGFEYELEICNVHFPMTVDFDKGKREVVIKNLLGEKHPRILKVKDNVEIKINAPKINVSSYDKELAGQTSADLEKVSRVKNRDRNKFQDGIFITKKPGISFL